MQDTRTGRRAAAVAAAMVLLVGPALAPLAGAATLDYFAEGTSVTLGPFEPQGQATLPFPNPSRAVSASVNVTTVTARDTVLLANASRGWHGEASFFPSPHANLSEYQPSLLGGAELAALQSVDAQNWSVNGSAARPFVLLEFDVTGHFLPGVPPPWEATVTVTGRTDGSLPTEELDFAVALYEEPPAGPAAWRDLAVAPDLPVPGSASGALLLPAFIERGPSKLFEVLVQPRNGSARLLDLDAVRVSFTRLTDPLSPQLLVGSPGEVVWQYRAPGGGPALFGRTVEDAAGGAGTVVLSNGSAAAGYSGDLYVPEGAVVVEAFAKLSPLPFAQNLSNASGPSNTTVAPFSADASPSSPNVGGVPLTAQPTLGAVTLYGLTAHGVVDARQETLSTLQTVGNFSAQERSAAQTVTVLSDGSIEGITLSLADATGHPVGPLTLEVRDVVAGEPGNTSLALLATNLTAARAGGWVTFTLDPPLAVTAGQELALVLSSPGSAANETWEWRGHDGVSADPYAAGSAFVSTAANGSPPWTVRTNVDMAFRLLLGTTFNESDAPFVSVAGALGPGARLANFSGAETGWRFEVPAAAVALVPDFAGGATWEIAVVNGLAYSVSFRWQATLEYEEFPRSVEFAVGNASAAVTLPELRGPTVVDFRQALDDALMAGNWTAAAQGGTPFALFPLRLRSDGPASVALYAYNISFAATVRVTGFEGALNRAIEATPSVSATADVPMTVGAPFGSVQVSDLRVLYSEPPSFQSSSLPTPVVPEGAVNVTVADLYQLFFDDLDGFDLNYTVDAVLPPAGHAEVHRSAVDGNLTLTMDYAEFSGSLFITVSATDSTGLTTTSLPMRVDVVGVDDPPVIAPIPDVVLQGTTGTFDLRPFVTDNDTDPATLGVSVSSVFASAVGLSLSFDYREAPASFLTEDITLQVGDGTTNVSGVLRVYINNAGRPVLSLPGPVTVTAGHRVAFPLLALAADDRDPPSSLAWQVQGVLGVGPTPGDGGARVLQNGSLEVEGTSPGDIEVSLGVRDLDGNLATGTLTVHITANLPPSWVALEGARFTVPQGAPLLVDLGPYLEDGDDVLANFSFVVSWDNGSVVEGAVENGTLVLRAVGTSGGHARVTVVAHDPAGAFDAAIIEVDVAGAPVPASQLLLYVLAGAGLAALAGLFLVAYKRRGRHQPSFSDLEGEEGEAEDEEEAEEVEAVPGLERTDEEAMLEKLEEMEHEAEVAKVEVPPVSILAPEGPAAASSLMLVYRDGRPISWVAQAAPSDKETEGAQELAAVLGMRARKAAAGDRVEGETVELWGKKVAVEARSQLVLGAVIEAGADEEALRARMRAALDGVFEANARALKRWNGSRVGLTGVEDALERVLKA